MTVWVTRGGVAQLYATWVGDSCKLSLGGLEKATVEASNNPG